MSWIKRNLYFLLGSLVAAGLLAVAILYLLQKEGADKQAMDALNQAYEELNRLNSLNPHPGSDKVDNIKTAKEQQGEVRAYLRKARDYFDSIHPIPDTTSVTTEDFTAQLRRTIDQLQKDASQASVTLPPKYNFTFESIKPKVTFAPASLRSLSVQLGEIKAICDALFRAKISALDNLRRERVAAEDDPQAAAADYLADTSVTNDLAVLTPYDISFRCFSSDLAGVISGFASSKNGFIIRYLNVEPAAATAGGPTPETPAYVPPPPPAYVPPPSYVPIRGRGDFFEQGGGPRPAPAPAPVPSGVATANRYATVINEKVFRVSLRVEVVKLLPQK